MSFTDQLNTPGEHLLMLEGELGLIEAVLTVPEQVNTSYAAVLGHPHSLQGGTMNNKVVTTLVRVFKELGIASLRFNFRGVGRSFGVYDEGLGESRDMLLFAKSWQERYPLAQFIFAGFSFGSYVAYRAAAEFPRSLLISIAPPVHHYDYHEFKPDFSSWLIIQGDADEVVPASLVFDFAALESPALPVIVFPDTGHFFHGKLIELKSQLIDYLRSQVGSL